MLHNVIFSAKKPRKTNLNQFVDNIHLKTNLQRTFNINNFKVKFKMNNKIIKKQMIMYKRSKMFARIKLTIEKLHHEITNLL